MFSTLYIRSTTKWVFKDIKVQSLLGANNNKLSLVTVTDQGAALPTSDIILQNMEVSSADSTDGWTKEQWLLRRRATASLGFSPRRGDEGSRHNLRFGDQLSHF